MQFDRISRRFFLRGLGGTSLAIPFLSSMVPKAFAENGTETANLKNIIFLKQSHGASYANIMPPSNLAYTDIGQGMRRAPMPDTFANFGASYAKANLADLKNQICHITGLDATFDSHDHWNNSLITGNPANALLLSVDQVIAKRIYGSQTPVLGSMTTGMADFSGEGPGYDDNGTIRRPPYFRSGSDTFRALFQSLTGASSESQNLRDKSAIDKVNADLKALLGNNRISQADKANLGNYLDLMITKRRRYPLPHRITRDGRCSAYPTMIS